MITKKCAASLITFCVSMLLIFAAVHFMAFFPHISQWIGVSIGGGVLIVSFILYLIYRKKAFFLTFLVIAISSLATGITISSLFVYLKAFPPVWHTAVLYACLVVLFVLYCMLTNLLFFRKHYVISLLIFCALLVTALILMFVYLKLVIDVLTGMSLIPMIAFLASLSIGAKDEKQHYKNIAFCSFGFLFVAVIVVLVVLSQGELLDGLDGGAGGDLGGGTYYKRNPYDYEIPYI